MGPGQAPVRAANTAWVAVVVDRRNKRGLRSALAIYPLSALSTTEAASLAFMREEEQPAHDAHVVRATLWQQAIFNNRNLL